MSSATAIALGMLQGEGSLGPSSLPAFAITSVPAHEDVLLRFHKSCPAYHRLKKRNKKLLKAERKRVLDAIAAELAAAHFVKLTGSEVGGLWAMCKVEIALLRRHIPSSSSSNTSASLSSFLSYLNPALLGGASELQTCSLLTEEQVLALEWLDDVETYRLKAYGCPLNYEMAVPLVQELHDLVSNAAEDYSAALASTPSSSIPSASKASGVRRSSSVAPLERLRLLVGHAETLIPIACVFDILREPDAVSLFGHDPTPGGCACRSGGKKEAEAAANGEQANCPWEGVGGDKEGGEWEQMEWAGMADVLSEAGREIIARRTFRGAHLSPFGANLGILLQVRDATGEMLVRVLHNEQPVALAGCGGRVDCTLSEFQALLQRFMAAAFDDICDVVVGEKGVKTALQDDDD